MKKTTAWKNEYGIHCACVAEGAIFEAWPLVYVGEGGVTLPNDTLLGAVCTGAC